MPSIFGTSKGWYWHDNLCEEAMGPFKSTEEAVADYEQVRGGLFCSEDCAQAFAADREHGLVYGAHLLWKMTSRDLCWYCAAPAGTG